MENEIEFEDIYNKLWPKIYSVCHRFVGEKDASDMAQETFMKFYKSMDKFKGKSSVYTYIYRIAVNLCLDKIKKDKKTMPLDASCELLPDDRNKSDDPLVDKKIYQAYKTLSKQRKTVIVLRILEGLSIKETAQIMELSIGAVKTHLFLAIKEMNEKLTIIRSELASD
ncbi:RNA polymerase sigma factor [candidate division WOR-3 bacterium]|nr:RNA polymerase sigma factor [candidate division WOR-3 bacterium]